MTIRITAAQARSIASTIAEVTGAQPDPATLHEDVARVVKRAQAATKNADTLRNRALDAINRARQVDATLAQTPEQARQAFAESIGRPAPGPLLRVEGSDLRAALRGEPIRLPDAPVIMAEATTGEIHTRSLAGASLADRPAPLIVIDPDAPPHPASVFQGVTGTPFDGSVPTVEHNRDLSPYLGRGLSYDAGQFMAAYRSNDAIRKGVASNTAVFADATFESVIPEWLTAKAADKLGIDRGQVERIADDFNLAFLGAQGFDPRAAMEEGLRIAQICGFSLAEFAIDPFAPHPTQRIRSIQQRLPNTVMQWIVCRRTGELVAVQQTNPSGYGRISPVVDIRRCIHIAIDRDGDNWEGTSLVRTARMWDVLLFELVSSEILHRQRFGPGVPVVRKLGGNSSQGASDQAYAALAKYANLSDAALELGPDVAVELLQMQADTGLPELVEMCTRHMRAAVMDSMAGLGEDDRGAMSLGDIKSQLWLKGLRAFARQVERGYNRMLRAYVDLVWGPQVVYPTMHLSGFATRSGAEVINTHTAFGALVTGGQYSELELAKIATQADVVYHGRGSEADADDPQAAGMGSGAARPVEPLSPTAAQAALAVASGIGSGSLAPAAAIELLKAIGLPSDAAERVTDAQAATRAPAAAEPVTTADDTEPRDAAPDGTPPPASAQRAAAAALQRRRTAPMDERWQAPAPELALAKRIAAGDALSPMDLRLIEAYFDSADPPATDDHGPAWQEYQAHGGDTMAAFVAAHFAEPDQVVARSVPAKYGHISFIPPAGVRAAARRALEVREEKPPAQRGMTPVGIARARDLANGRPVSPETARRMLAFFERHEGNKSGATWGEQGKGWQAWHGWGGDAGLAWARKLIRQMDAADAPADSRHATGCGCGACDVDIRAASGQRFTVKTRTGDWITWRALTPVEEHASFDGIDTAIRGAVADIDAATARIHREHRAAFVQQAQPLIESMDVAAIAALSVPFRSEYRAAVLDTLRGLWRWTEGDTLQEIASQIGSETWRAVPQQARGPSGQQWLRSQAEAVARILDDRAQESFRDAALTVAQGAPAVVLTRDDPGFGQSAAVYAGSAARVTVNEARSATALGRGPRAALAIYTAVMDRTTCGECADRDGTETRVGSELYRKLTPPNPQCSSAKRGPSMCNCIWVYEYDVEPTDDEDTRSADGRQVVILHVGPPGAGKSTSARAIAGGAPVIDRDEYTLTPEGYDGSGRARADEALTEAVKGGAPVVHYVGCLLSPAARERVRAMLPDDVRVLVVPYGCTREHAHAVNAARRAEDPARYIAPMQLDHMLDAWDPSPLAP